MSGTRAMGVGLRAANSGLKNIRNDLHVTAARALPQAAPLQLPENVQDINASEVGCFSPLRSRDISGSFISSQESWGTKNIDVTLDSDPHIGPYDCSGAVSLSSSMQSNVPSPFGGGRQGFLGMPGSQWGQGYKYLSDHLHSSHYLNLRNTYGRGIHGTGRNSGTINLYHTRASKTTPIDGNLFLNRKSFLTLLGNANLIRMTSSDTKESNESGKPLSRKQQLKQAVAAYGSTVIVFHVTISLASLGVCYVLVSSGLDVMAWMEHFGLTDSEFTKKIAANAGTFVVAYAIHKVFAPGMELFFQGPGFLSAALLVNQTLKEK
ncbi:uncharacterized protein LOC143915432 isoform X2 [Arctopsyche grandis]|uniref:uncharacterized protein LOC143915432 isoform X2 n=1 Tax=Arctopsyche grandis TaxID=121162 RepID=UPI00406D884E